jgi:hypothetical protein
MNIGQPSHWNRSVEDQKQPSEAGASNVDLSVRMRILAVDTQAPKEAMEVIFPTWHSTGCTTRQNSLVSEWQISVQHNELCPTPSFTMSALRGRFVHLLVVPMQGDALKTDESTGSVESSNATPRSLD